MRALVTGAAGFIGSHLTERLLNQGAEVIAVDSFTDYYPRWMKQLNLAQAGCHPSCTFIEGDLTRLDLSPLLERVDYVFHHAAFAGVRASWGSAFEGYLRNNVLATQCLLEAAKHAPVRKFIYASSSSIYGDAESFPTPETTTPRPISPYGATKLAGEHLCFLYWRRSGVPTVALRYFTVYGPRQRPDMAFHIFIRALLAGQALEIYGDGRHSRDFTYVSDIVTTNLLAAEKGRPGQVYNVGGGAEVPLNDVVRTLKTLTGRDVPIHYMEVQGGDPRRTAADTALAREELGFQPEVDLEQGLRWQIGWLEDILSMQPPADYERAKPDRGRSFTRS